MKPRRDPPRPSPDIAALAAVRRLAGTAAMEGSIPAVWGHISGVLSDQTDLSAALAAKLDDSQAGTFGLTLLAAVSLAAAKTSLAYTKADVGLGSVDNTADVNKAVLSATKLATARNIDGQAFDGTAPITIIAPGTHAATSKATPVDADELPLADSAATFGLKKLTWANLKATLKTYLDTLYLAVGGTAAAATKLATGRTIAMTGDVVWTSPAFDGTSNVTAAGTIQANTVTFAKMVAATAPSIVGATAAGNFAQLTPAQAKTVLAIAVADISGVDTDGTLAANSDSRIATQKATKTYVDQIIAAQDAMVFKGVIDCSASPNYPAADRGHTYRVSVAGKIGGASGTNVEIGDLLLCLTDGTAAGTQAAVGTAWSIAQTNLDGAVIGPASATDAGIAGYSGTSGKLIKQLSAAEVRAAADFTSATSKTTPVDADELPLVDSAASNVIKKLTWANLKATLKTYLDTLYQPLAVALTSWAAVVRATGFDTFTATPSSANLRALLTDETGTGNAVFSASPTLTGTVTAANANHTGVITFAGTSVTRSGTGVQGELLCTATGAYFQGYDKTGNAVAPVGFSGSRFDLQFVTVGNFANDAAAATGGVPVGSVYRNGSALMIRVT